jgi:hypothetical protein
MSCNRQSAKAFGLVAENLLPRSQEPRIKRFLRIRPAGEWPLPFSEDQIAAFLVTPGFQKLAHLVRHRNFMFAIVLGPGRWKHDHAAVEIDLRSPPISSRRCRGVFVERAEALALGLLRRPRGSKASDPAMQLGLDPTSKGVDLAYASLDV